VLLTIGEDSKTSAATGRGLYVPRFLPGLVAKVYVAYVTELLPIRSRRQKNFSKPASFAIQMESVGRQTP
jgi:hypothetical protein